MAGGSKARDKGRLALADDVPLADGLGRALESVIAHAREAAARAERKPTQAVHDYRKSLRRARALVKLTRPLLADADYSRLAAILRETQRAASPLRDEDALRDVARRLGGDVKLPGPVLRSLRRDPLDVLPDGARRLKPVARRFAEAIPREVAWDDLARSLRKSYRRARRAMKDARRSGRPSALHDWRKATKELTYQLELLGTRLGDRGVRERKRFSELAEELGEVTDLVLLERHLDRALRKAPRRTRDRLAKVRREARKRMSRTEERAFARGRRLYRRRPRRFLDQELARAARRAARRGRTSHKKTVAAAQSQAKTSPTAA